MERRACEPVSVGVAADELWVVSAESCCESELLSLPPLLLNVSEREGVMETSAVMVSVNSSEKDVLEELDMDSDSRENDEEDENEALMLIALD